MFDNNEYINSLFGDLSSSTTTQTEEQSTYSPQTSFSPFASNYERDDYSSTQNFTEQQSYNSSNNTFFGDVQEKKVTQMHTPMIEKGAEVVNLVKSQSRIKLEARMKVVLSVFSVIVACLLFITVFNFIQTRKLESQFASKQLQINQLEQDIINNQASYTWIDDETELRRRASEAGFTNKSNSNTMHIPLDEMYKENAVEEVPSNWFNDICEFFSKLIA
jgi:hypothetical protein